MPSLYEISSPHKLQYKTTIKVFVPLFYTFLFTNCKLMLRFFYLVFVFFHGAPVRILYTFIVHRCPYTPSSLSARNTAQELIKHSHAEQKNKRKGWGLLSFGAFSLSFLLKKESKKESIIYIQCL